MSEDQEKGVSNNKFFRGISNFLDDVIPGFKDSSVRAEIHGIYHQMVAQKKYKAGNIEGAEAEMRRAEEQFERARNGLPGEYGD